MKHFKPEPLAALDKELFLLWLPSGDAVTFKDEGEAAHWYAEDRRADRAPRMYRFNPACPGETRDLTDEFEEAYRSTTLPPDDESDWDYHDGSLQERERPHLVTSTRGHSYARDGGV